MISLLFIVYSLWLVAIPVFAQTPAQPPPSPSTCEPGGLMKSVSTPCACEGKCELIDFLKLGRGVAQEILKYIGVLALIFFIIGGIIWIISSGNQERIKKGKHILVGTLIGMVIVFLAWQIVNLVICAVSQGQIQETCTIFGNQKWNVFPQ